MSDTTRKKRAIVLFNLGGPDSPEAVEPFCSICSMIRRLSACPIRSGFAGQTDSHRRAPVAREIYDHIGGKSPLLELTQEQADALQIALNGEDDGYENRCFIAMRYWKPLPMRVPKPSRPGGG